MKEFRGIKLAIIGVTTPGMPFWFRPEFIRGLDFPHPVEPVRRAIAQARAAGAHAIVLAGHMGLKDRTGGDDFANTLTSLTHEFPEIAVLIAGHTHQVISSRVHHNALLTQADHFGIHVGRVDLIFDRASKKLLGRRAHCELMDNRFAPDPVIVSRARPLLEDSTRTLSQRIGELAQSLGVRNSPGKPSEVEMLIGAAVMEALRERKVEVDGVLHGLFDEERPMTAGPKTIADMWKVLPYENYVVTAELTGEEIRETMEEIFEVQRRNLMGFKIETEGKGKNRIVTNMGLDDGRPVEMARRYRIAMNSFDSRSAGHRFMILRELLEMPESRTQLHPVQTRDALIEYFRRHKIVRPVRSLRPLPAAA
jgi:2',3'-cyclic-nucleotide 2'-phosphodiesterase/3'-nucleotidase